MQTGNYRGKGRERGGKRKEGCKELGGRSEGEGKEWRMERESEKERERGGSEIGRTLTLKYTEIKLIWNDWNWSIIASILIWNYLKK